jgi:DNA-binding response OmpR family regulator
VYGIVRQSGGTVDVRSVSGQGTTFRVYFPRTEVPIANASAAENPTAGSGNETILVVDDDLLVLRTVGDHLRELGYKPLITPSAREAAELSRVYESRIDLLLTDLVMPEMTGPELRREVERWRPLIQTLYMTGYSSDRVPVAEIEPQRLVRKPFTPDSLSAGIRRLLDVPASQVTES